jgi:protease secretion system membrane fusion protein
LNAAEGELARVELKAPVDGQVVGLEVQSVGAVIQPAQKIMDIVPSDEPLLLEAQVPPQFIDRVRPGQTVTVRFSAFAHSPALSVDGTLDSISHDLVEEQTAGGEIKYYLARIGLTPEGVKKLGERQMQPGMPAEAVIKTGERTLLTYLLHPLTKRLARAMKEE